MSHQEYIAKCDEGQLERLIELAQARLKEIRSSGFVKLWTVSVGWGNVGWFAEADHAAAVEFAVQKVKAAARDRTSSGIEMEISLEKYRPDEVADLLTRAAPQPQEQKP